MQVCLTPFRILNAYGSVEFFQWYSRYGFCPVVFRPSVARPSVINAHDPNTCTLFRKIPLKISHCICMSRAHGVHKIHNAVSTRLQSASSIRGIRAAAPEDNSERAARRRPLQRCASRPIRQRNRSGREGTQSTKLYNNVHWLWEAAVLVLTDTSYSVLWVCVSFRLAVQLPSSSSLRPNWCTSYLTRKLYSFSVRFKMLLSRHPMRKLYAGDMSAVRS